MRTSTAIALAIVMILIVLLPYLSSILTSQKRPSIEEYLKEVGEYVVRVGEDKYLVVKPPSWQELFDLALRGLASYWYIAPCTAGDLRYLYHLYVIENKSCEEIIEEFKPFEGLLMHYAFFLRKNCKLLKTFLFNNTPDWYLAYGFVKSLENRRLKEYTGNAYLWTLVYEVDEGLMIELYNILNKTQFEELKERIGRLISENHVLVLMTRWAISTWWYKLYRYLKEKDIPYTVLIFSGSKRDRDLDPEQTFRVFKELLEFVLEGALDRPIYGHDIPSFTAVIYVDGKPVAVVVPQLSECRFFTEDVLCKMGIGSTLKRVLGIED